MTFMALVSADLRAVSKPFTTSSSEKPSRWVTNGRTSIFLLANRLRHSGYCRSDTASGATQQLEPSFQSVMRSPSMQHCWDSICARTCSQRSVHMWQEDTFARHSIRSQVQKYGNHVQSKHSSTTGKNRSAMNHSSSTMLPGLSIVDTT